MRPAVGFAICLSLVACVTTHQIGRLDDPATRAQLQQVLSSHPETTATLVEDAPPPDAAPFDRRGKAKAPILAGRPLAALAPRGLLLTTTPGQTALVPSPQVLSLTTTDRLRGFRDGALGCGIPTFLVSALLVGLMVEAGNNCSDGCTKRDPVPPGLGIGTILGAAAAVVCGGIGAAAGHRDVYVPVRDQGPESLLRSQ